MAAFNPVNIYSADVANGDHDFGVDTLKLYLTNTLPDAADEADADLPTEVANGNGYLTGGLTLDSVVVSTVTTNDAKVDIADEVMTASGGSIGPFRYAVLINSTSDSVIGWWDRGSSLTLADGESVTFDFDGANGVLTFTVA